MKKSTFTAAFTINNSEAQIPDITDGQVLLKVVNIGICGSDIQMYHGLHKYMTYPVVPGHEVAAVIERVGAGVRDYKAGQRVTVEPQIYCGECYPCTIGRFNVCENLRVKGVHADGFAAEYVAIEPKYLHPCPDEMDFDLITLAEPLAVGIGAVKRSNYKGANVAVIGAGTIGNLTAQAAQALGAGSVMITDIAENKLDYARKCGIKNCVNTSSVSLSEAVTETFGKRAADVIIDCAATGGSFSAALEASRAASEIVITGNFKAPVALELPRIQRREVNLIGHMMYVREDFADAIAFLSSGKINTDGFITRKYPAERFAEAFAFIDANPGDVMKILVEL